MTPINARQLIARSVLSRSYNDKPPLGDDSEYALFARSAMQAGADPLGDTLTPEVLTRIVLDGCAFVATHADDKIAYAARQHPLNHLPETPAFVADTLSVEDIQLANESLFGQSPLIEKPLPDGQEEEIRSQSKEQAEEDPSKSMTDNETLQCALLNADYPPPVPPQFDPSVVDRGISRENISTAYYISPGHIYELITESTTVANTQQQPLYLRLSPRPQPPHVPSK